MNTLINLGDYIILIHNTAAENYDSRIKYKNERRQTAHYFVYPIIYYRSYCSIMKILRFENFTPRKLFSGALPDHSDKRRCGSIHLIAPVISAITAQAARMCDDVPEFAR